LSFQLPEIPVPSKAGACAVCGLVWSELDAVPCEENSTDLGNEEVKRHLGIEKDE